MKYYVDIVYMIINGVTISNDKNKKLLKQDKNILKDLVYQILKRDLVYQILKKDLV